MNPYKTFGAMLLAVAVLCGPLIGGMQSEKLYLQLVNRLQHDMGLHIEKSEYRSGYLGSDAYTRIKIYPQEPYFEQAMEIGFHTRISHGLLGVEATTTLDLTAQQNKILQPYTQGKEPIELKFEANWLGNYGISLHTAKFSVAQNAVGKTYLIEPVLLESEISDDWDQFTLSGNWGGARFSKNGKEILDIQSLKLEQQSEKNTDFIWVGDSELDIESIKIQHHGQPLVFEGLQFLSNSEINEGRVNSQLLMTSDNLLFKDKTYPGHHVEIQLNEIDVDGFDTLLATLDDIQRTPISLDPAHQAQQQMDQYERVTQDLSALLNKGFRLEIPRMELTIPEGRVEGKAAIRQPESQLHNGIVETGPLLARTYGELELKMPAGLLNARSDRIEDWLQRKWLIREGDSYQTRANLEHMIVRVNGIEYPLPPLL